MKILVLLFSTHFMIIGNSFSQNDAISKIEITKQYCAVLKNDKITVNAEGKEMVTDVTLLNGSVIQPNGSIVKKDGTQISLKNKECIDGTGNMIKSSGGHKMTPEKSKMIKD